MLRIGSHMEMKAPHYLVGAVKETIRNEANAFMIYSGAPQNTIRKDVSLFHLEEAHQLMKEHNIPKEHFIVHAPYIINLGNTLKEETFEIAVKALRLELDRTRAMGANTLVLHPGSHVGEGVDAGVKQIAKGLDLAMEGYGDIHIALETMSGKGSELGYEFAQLRAIFDLVRNPSSLAVCMDTCHLHDAGYPIADFDSVLREFQTYFPLDLIRVIHVNDSKNSQGARKDRHANLGFGEIGFEALLGVIEHPLVEHAVKILETPYIKTHAPYKKEIAMIKSRMFDPAIFDDYK